MLVSAVRAATVNPSSDHSGAVMDKVWKVQDTACLSNVQVLEASHALELMCSRHALGFGLILFANMLLTVHHDATVPNSILIQIAEYRQFSLVEAFIGRPCNSMQRSDLSCAMAKIGDSMPGSAKPEQLHSSLNC